MLPVGNRKEASGHLLPSQAGQAGLCAGALPRAVSFPRPDRAAQCRQQAGPGRRSLLLVGSAYVCLPQDPLTDLSRGPLSPPWCSGRVWGPGAEPEVGAQPQSCAGRTAALTVGTEPLLGAERGVLARGAGPSVGLDAVLPLPCPVGCDEDHVPWSWGAASCRRTAHKQSWPCVSAWGHLELPKGQKELERCLSLSSLRAGAQLRFPPRMAGPWQLRRRPHGEEGPSQMGPSGHPSPWTGVGRECSAWGLLRRPPTLPVCPHPTSCRSCLGSLARGCVRLPRPVGFGRAPSNATFFPRAFRKQTCSFFPSFPPCFGLAGDGWVAVGAGLTRRAPCLPAALQVAGWGEWAAASPFAQDTPAGRGQETPQHIARSGPGWKVPVGHPSRGSLSRSGSLEPVGTWGWGLQAPLLPPQPCLAQRGHPGTAGASSGSPAGKQKGIKCLFRGREVRSRCPPAVPVSPGTERVPGQWRLQWLGSS